MVRRDPVVIAWIVGLCLAAIVYFVGPDRFFFRLEDTLHVLAWRVAEALNDLSATVLEVVRALSIGLYITFLGLCIAVTRRGGRAKFAAVVVTVLMLLLVEGASPGDQTRWIAALMLSGVGALVMTGRLRHADALTRR